MTPDASPALPITPRLGRRRFLALASGLVVTSACSGIRPGTRPADSTSSAADSAAGRAPVTTAVGSPTVVEVLDDPAGAVPGDRVLVVVTLDGGNDAVNTVPPDLGSYRDLRPTIALAETDIVRSTMLPDHGLHPALSPLLEHLEGGRIAVVAGIGFPDPDRSHFTSTDRWDRADRMDDAAGWLGRWLDTLDQELPTLGATALGGSGAVLVGEERSGAAIADVEAFAFPTSVSHADVRALASLDADDDPLRTAARTAFSASVGAVEEFDAVADAVRTRSASTDGPSRDPDRRPGLARAGSISTGLAVAAELISGPTRSRVVTVTATGFDTHSAQLDQHEALLDDLASGLAAFRATLEAAGESERVLVITTSEFGRRVVENGSAGCDHGAAGLSFVMGDSVVGGLHGRIDTDRLLDGDLAPLFDPRSLFTVALDWLGGDVERILGERWDELELLA